MPGAEAQPQQPAAGLVAPAPPPSRPPAASGRLEVLPGAGGAKTIAMEFTNLDIDHLLRLLSTAAQVTIVKSEQVSGPVTIISPEPVPLDVAFQILDSVLQVRGWTMVKMPNGIYKVVAIADAMQSGLPVQFGSNLEIYPPGDELITQVIPLRNLSANDVASQLQSVLSQGASIIPTSTNSLIITDTAANIHRALAIIGNAEEELSGGLKVYRLQYYDASDMADLVTSIVLGRGGLAGAMGGAPRPTWERRVVGRAAAQPARGPAARQATPVAPGVAAAGGIAATGPEFAYPDTRTNSLIVLATPLHRRQIEDLVKQLDQPVSLSGSYFVYPVQNLVASELAASVAPLIGAEVTKTGGAQATTGGAGGGVGTVGQRRRSDTGAYTQPFGSDQGRRYRGGSFGASSSDTGTDRLTRPLQLEPLSGEGSLAPSADAIRIAQAPAVGVVAAPVQVPAQPEAPMAGMGETQPVPAGADEGEPATVSGAAAGQPVIVADDNTNTLLISASPEQIDLVEQMLEKLDALPPQVHIRAIIAEVTLSRDTSLGFQWDSLGRSWGHFKGNLFTGDVGTNLGLKNVVRDANGKVTSTPSGFFATLTGDQFEAVVNALTSDTRARILSAPSIFTASNQEARIDISQQIPIPTGTFQTTTGAGTISTSIGYRSVGIVLEVTPRVTQGNVVQMDVSVSADEPGAEVVVADLSYPSINQRLAEATISVKNGYTVVLGGLMRESTTRTASRVPLLGDLPLIGPLFSSTKDQKSKSELLLFLTPFVVRNPAEIQAVSERERSRLPEVPKSLRGSLSGPEEEWQEPEAPQIEPPAVEIPAPPSLQSQPAPEAENPKPAAPTTSGAQAPATPSPAPEQPSASAAPPSEPQATPPPMPSPEQSAPPADPGKPATS